MRWIAHILVNSLVLIVVAGYFESFYIDNVGSAIIASIIIAVLNAIVKPILILLTLPVTVLTFGLFLFVINAITLMMADSIMCAALEIDGFGAAVMAAIFISLLNLLIQKVVIEPLSKKDER